MNFFPASNDHQLLPHPQQNEGGGEHSSGSGVGEGSQPSIRVGNGQEGIAPLRQDIEPFGEEWFLLSGVQSTTEPGSGEAGQLVRLCQDQAEIVKDQEKAAYLKKLAIAKECLTQAARLSPMEVAQEMVDDIKFHSYPYMDETSKKYSGQGGIEVAIPSVLFKDECEIPLCVLYGCQWELRLGWGEHAKEIAEPLRNGKWAGLTPLMISVLTGDTRCIELLLEVAGPNRAEELIAYQVPEGTFAGFSAMTLAAACGTVKTMGALLGDRELDKALQLIRDAASVPEQPFHNAIHQVIHEAIDDGKSPLIQCLTEQLGLAEAYQRIPEKYGGFSELMRAVASMEAEEVEAMLGPLTPQEVREKLQLRLKSGHYAGHNALTLALERQNERYLGDAVCADADLDLFYALLGKLDAQWVKELFMQRFQLGPLLGETVLSWAVRSTRCREVSELTKRFTPNEVGELFVQTNEGDQGRGSCALENALRLTGLSRVLPLDWRAKDYREFAQTSIPGGNFQGHNVLTLAATLNARNSVTLLQNLMGSEAYRELLMRPIEGGRLHGENALSVGIRYGNDDTLRQLSLEHTYSNTIFDMIFHSSSGIGGGFRERFRAGFSELMKAVVDGNVEEIDRIISPLDYKKTMDLIHDVVPTGFFKGLNSLQFAVMKGSLDIVTLLVDKFNEKDLKFIAYPYKRVVDSGPPPIIMSALYKNRDLMRFFLSKFSGSDMEDYFIRADTVYDMPMYANACFGIVVESERGDVMGIQPIEGFRSHYENVEIVKQAVIDGSQEMVDQLLGRMTPAEARSLIRSEFESESEDTAASIFHFAVQGGDIGLIRNLLERFDPAAREAMIKDNMLSFNSLYSTNAIGAAIRHGELGALKFLLDSVAPEDAESLILDEETLEYALAWKRLDSIEAILSRVAPEKVNEFLGEIGEDDIFGIGAYDELLEVDGLSELMRRFAPDVKVETCLWAIRLADLSPLMKAAASGKADKVRAVLNGLSPREAKEMIEERVAHGPYKGCTAISLAARMESSNFDGNMGLDEEQPDYLAIEELLEDWVNLELQ